MNPEVKTQWLAALRGEEYQQAEGGLRLGRPEHGPVCHCCLGVLCDLHAKATGGRWEPSVACGDNAAAYLNEVSYLPREVQAWAGLLDLNPTVVNAAITTTLSSLNDNGATFKQIADLIEAQL